MPLILIKIGRLTNVIVFMVDVARRTKGLISGALLGPLVDSRPEPKIGWGLQLLDNVSVSLPFCTIADCVSQYLLFRFSLASK